MLLFGIAQAVANRTTVSFFSAFCGDYTCNVVDEISVPETLMAYRRGLPAPIGRGDRFVVTEQNLLARLSPDMANRVRQRTVPETRQFEFLVMGIFPDKLFRKNFLAVLMNPFIIMRKLGHPSFLEFLDASFVTIPFGDFDTIFMEMGVTESDFVSKEFMIDFQMLFLTAVSYFKFFWYAKY